MPPPPSVSAELFRPEDASIVLSLEITPKCGALSVDQGQPHALSDERDDCRRISISEVLVDSKNHMSDTSELNDQSTYWIVASVYLAFNRGTEAIEEAVIVD
jgi:hypothetical protein